MSNDRSGEIDELNWRFGWEVSDSEGLTLKDGRFLDMPIFNKLSLPAIRVKYYKDADGDMDVDWSTVDTRELFELFQPLTGAGPFIDQIRWKKGTDHGLQKVSENNNEYVGIVRFYAHPPLSTRWMRLSVYARIGAYHIKQEWHLSEHGAILPRVWSKGLHANIDHTHHPYWRFDFDIGEPLNNNVLVEDGGNWAHYLTEYDDVKSNYVDPRWYVENTNNQWGVWIVPGANDGHADDFSTMDIAVRLFHQQEAEKPWPFGVGELGFMGPPKPADNQDPEPVDNKDIVFWYIAHLFHDASDHGNAWHGAGPNIHVHRGIEIPTATKDTGRPQARPRRPSPGRVTEDTSRPQKGRPPSS